MKIGKKIGKLKRCDPIRVLWLDSHSLGGKMWMDEDEVMAGPKKVKITSYCQYLTHDKHYLYTVADQTGGKDFMSGVMRDLKIPRGAITSLRKLT